MTYFLKIFKRMLIILFSVVGLFLILLFILLIYSPGEIEPYLDPTGKLIPESISEKTFVKIYGIQQGMFIKSKNRNNPILLYVHGGPAFPNYFLINKFMPDLEDYFTVCYWEQRGDAIDRSKLTPDRYVTDAHELVLNLRQRFGKEKIYIMAHSGGTPIALLSVQKKPQLYAAYIGMGQITNQAESEKVAYKYMLEHYRTDENQKAITELKKYPVLDSDSNILSFYKSNIRDQYMHELGIGTMHEMKSVFWGIFIPIWTCKAYTLREKINIWKSKILFIPKTNLINEMLETDFTSQIPKLEIPVYFFSGKFDLTVNVNLSKAYLNKLQAPLKGFYTFNNSAHSPLFEEPLLVRQIIERDILNDSNSLADKN